MQTWTAEQAATFLRAAAGDRLYPAWLLALACGLRSGELCGLRWSDVDLERQTLSIVSQRTTDADWQVITKAKAATSEVRILGRIASITLSPGSALIAVSLGLHLALEQLTRAGIV